MAIQSSSSSHRRMKLEVVSSSSSSHRCMKLDVVSSSSHRFMKLEMVPEEVLELILRRLSNIRDVFRFGAVCRTFHRITKNSTHNGLPLLALGCNFSSDKMILKCFAHYNYPSKSTCRKRLLVFPTQYTILCEAMTRMRPLGSSHGWLLLCPKVFDEPEPKIVLLDPLSGHQRFLPHPDQYPGRLEQVIFSSSPSSPNNNIIAVASFTYHCKSLAFARFRVVEQEGTVIKTKWTRFDDDGGAPEFRKYQGIIFYNEVLYAMTRRDQSTVIIVAFDMDAVIPKRSRVITLPSGVPPNFSDQHKTFLSKFHGDLLLVHFSRKRELQCLQIHKLNDKSTSITTTSTTPPTNATWTQVRSLDGGALFISPGSDCISRSTPSIQCCMKNSVYILWNKSIYVFNLEEGSVKHHKYSLSTLFWLDLRCPESDHHYPNTAS